MAFDISHNILIQMYKNDRLAVGFDKKYVGKMCSFVTIQVHQLPMRLDPTSPKNSSKRSQMYLDSRLQVLRVFQSVVKAIVKLYL